MSIVHCAMNGESHVGGYRRALPVTLERLYENALDFEHLPHLHHSSFRALECLDWGAWGWRAAITDARGRDAQIELRLDRSNRSWITRTLSGHGAGASIYTIAEPVAPLRVDIDVRFYVPELAPQQRARAAAALARLYARLYDEDVAMMTERQRQLEQRVDRSREGQGVLDLGPRASLTLPCRVTLGGRAFVVAEAAGTLVAFPAQCPHQLGPLSAAALQGTVVRCPWHGDRFDVVTGENLSGRPCRLSHMPAVSVGDDDRVRLAAHH